MVRESSVIRDYLHPLAQAFTPTWPKGIVGGIVGFLALLYPVQALRDLMVLTVVLLVVDTSMGVLAIFVEGKAFESSKFRRVIGKSFGYFVVPASIYWSAKILSASFGSQGFDVMTASIVCGFVVLTELVSILENARRCGMGIPKKVITALRGKAKEMEGADPAEEPP